ncbi:hypothetical protein J6590_025772 [Homalodisca vitripennis]|nr:hypothetical protein J6590_025772 [Homalodisca vitripennis]
MRQWCKGDSSGCLFVTSRLTSPLIARLSNLQTVAGHIATAFNETSGAKNEREKYSSAGDKEGFKKGNNKIESQSKRAARRNKALLKSFLSQAAILVTLRSDNRSTLVSCSSNVGTTWVWVQHLLITWNTCPRNACVKLLTLCPGLMQLRLLKWFRLHCPTTPLHFWVPGPQDLEVAAGRLRVQSCYSPTEAHLEKAKQRYEQTLAELRRSSETCSSEHN